MKKRHDLQNPPPIDVQEVVSSSECTGLMPVAVEEQSEVKNQKELYALHQAMRRSSK